ncbi:MAG: carotenoid oxygenase family protein, partial [Cyanobacteria bacterium J06638_22]
CAWAKAFDEPMSEFPLTPLSVIEGSIPDGLRGTLYQNGPGRLERGGDRMGHWFDGDGAVLAVHFAEGAARATYRFVQTAGYRAEAEAGRLIFGNYGTVPAGPLWQRFGKSPKNVANTSVMQLGDRLLTLWEAGEPYGLDLETLETLGTAPLDQLAGLPYSAHPKRDPLSGEVYNFGVTFGASTTLQVYRSDRQGKLLRRARFPLPGTPLIHDFVLAGRYLVFLIPPVRISTLPLLLNLKSASDAMSWLPQEGTQILVLDRETLELVGQGVADPWYQWHFGNGVEDADGRLRITLVSYPDFSTNQYLKEVPTGRVQTTAKGTLWEVCIAPQSGTVLDMQLLVERACEFPTVAATDVGVAQHSTYLAVHQPGQMEKGEIFEAIAHFHHPTETLTVADCGSSRYPSEPLFVPYPDDPENGWLLTVVFDGVSDRSEVWIYERDHLADGPCCRLALPNPVALGFHGTWSAT